MAKKGQENWTRAQVLQALSLYCTLPFGKFDKKNAEVIALASVIGRSANAVAMKLSNLASLDPYHKSRGVAGLAKASDLDREVWQEFYGRWDRLADELPQVEAEGAVPEFRLPSGPTSIERLLQIRRGQRFFRKAVLSAYQHSCCITGIQDPNLLRASHIVPWSESEENRLNPRNGLCLNALHDAAFDSGLLTLDDDLKVQLAPALAKAMPREAFAAHFEPYASVRISQPERFAPSLEFVQSHRRRWKGA